MNKLQLLSHAILAMTWLACVDSELPADAGRDTATATGGASVTTGGTMTTTGGATARTGGTIATGGTPNMTGGTLSIPAGTGGCVAARAVAEMKIGWNLGNSLDSVNANSSDTEVETAWGNPKITPALIQAAAKAGFGVIRIPVTWLGRFGAAPEYTIRATFMARVEEVVKMVLDQNLYAIINIHHDGGKGVAGLWLNMSGDSATVQAQFKKMWAQIAERFKGYGDRLIFESMNEVQGTAAKPTQANFDLVNALNKGFVETIRASGGNNANRCLVVPGYNTNIDHTLKGFVAPADPSPGKLILSAHYYDPWTFAGSAATHAWGAGNAGIDNWGQEDWIRSQVAKLKTTYIDKGIPVVWGEYGAVNQTGYEKYRRYYMEYVTKAARDVGIVPIYWDNGSAKSGGEAFGLFNRSNNTVLHPTILDAMIRAATSSYALADVAKP